MIPQQSALLRLLSDDDPATVKLVKAQLAGAGAERLPDLQALVAEAAPVAARQLREVIVEIERSHADTIFAQVCRDFGEQGDLEEAAFRLAAAFLPNDDFDLARRQLEGWADEVRRRLRKALGEVDRVETLVEFLGEDLQLRGNVEDYHNIVNSLLPHVIDSRRGIPITLSLIYLLVGRRVGLDFAGVGLPGHFVVRCGAHFFDPFHGGRRLGVEDCRAIAERAHQRLSPQSLIPVTPRQMLARMLANIRALAAEPDPPLAAKVDQWMEALQGGKKE